MSVAVAVVDFPVAVYQAAVDFPVAAAVRQAAVDLPVAAVAAVRHAAAAA